MPTSFVSLESRTQIFDEEISEIDQVMARSVVVPSRYMSSAGTCMSSRTDYRMMGGQPVYATPTGYGMSAASDTPVMRYVILDSNGETAEFYPMGCSTYIHRIYANGQFLVINDMESMTTRIEFNVFAGVSCGCQKYYRQFFAITIMEITRLGSSFEEFMNELITRMRKEVEHKLEEDNKEIWQQWQDKVDKDAWLVWNNLDMGQVEELAKTRNPEEMERRRAERDRLEEEKVEQEKRLKESAQKRAEALLKEIVSEVDFTTYKKDGYIEVLAKSGKKYRVKNDRFQSNVEVYQREKKEWKYQHRLCAHLQDTHIPIEDNVVAQVLMLRHDENRFLQMANVHQ